MKGFANQMKDFGFDPECERDPLECLKRGNDVVSLAIKRRLPAGVAQLWKRQGT